MPSFHCRQILPSESMFLTVDAPTAAEAANAFHYETRLGGYVMGDTDGGRYSIIEVDEGQKFLSRVFFQGIGRKGGVIPPDSNRFASFEALAKKLEVSVGALTASEGWEHEDPVGSPDTGYRKPVSWDTNPS